MLRRTILVVALLTIGIAPILPISLAVAQDRAPTNDYWWPNRLSLEPLRQTSPESSPLGEGNDTQSGDKRISLADLIVLGGAAAIERAAASAGVDVDVPFAPGRMDASEEQTDVESFALLEPTADGFRKYFGGGNPRSPAEMLVEKAALLNLTAPEMTVLVGGMRAMNANAGARRTACSPTAQVR